MPDPVMHSLEESIEHMHLVGAPAIQAEIQGMEKYDPDPDHQEVLKVAHAQLQAVGYLLQWLYKKPENFFRAGGTNKGPW